MEPVRERSVHRRCQQPWQIPARDASFLYARPEAHPVPHAARNARTWTGDRRHLAVTGLSCDHLDLIIWVHDRAEELRGACVVPRDAGWNAVVRSLVKAMGDPFSQGDPARPDAVRFRPEKGREGLREALQIMGVRLHAWKQSRALDAAYRWVTSYICTGPGHAYLERDGVTPAAVGELFDAAATFHEAFGTFAEVEAGVFAIRGLAERELFVLVHGGPPKFQVYDSLQDAEADRAGRLGRLAAAQVLRFCWDDFHHMGPALMRDIITHRWRMVDSDAIPVLSRLGMTTNEVVPSDPEFRFAAEVMRGVVRRLFDKQEEYETSDGRRISVSVARQPRRAGVVSVRRHVAG